MGQKVHPIGFRIGINKDWQSHWFARGKDYEKFLHEDLKIREYVRKRFKEAGISKVIVDRAADKLSVTIHTARPGMVIGRRGQEVESLRRELTQLVGYKDININVVEVRIPPLSHSCP